MENAIYDIIIIGGGLAGLTAAIALSNNNVNVLLIEKQEYPHHKVCGEYVSNEVLAYIESLGVFPIDLGAKIINKLLISQKSGKEIKADLPLGGFGISRYTLDLALYNKAKEQIEIVHTTASEILYDQNLFTIQTLEAQQFQARHVIGSFGKRSSLDKVLQRDFSNTKSPWLGVKAHYEYDFNEDVVALHNFEGGYCGLSKIETNAVNACYLTTYESFKKAGDIVAFQQTIMSENPYLKHFFENATMLFEKPLSISQISFDKKEPVKNHVFMLGDSAGLIHPLCGNGMAMAIHSAKLFTELYSNASTHVPRKTLEKAYAKIWKKTFSKRLQHGRYIQKMLLNTKWSEFAYKATYAFPWIVPYIVKQTHGDRI